jgi:hypothetical protein
MNFLRTSAGLMLAFAMVLPALASADEPATRPTTVAPGEGPPRPLRALLALGVARINGVRPYTSQEWDQMMDFLHTNSPERFSVLSHVVLPENLRMDLIRKWRNYNFVKEHFPAVADVQLRRFHYEDDLFLLVLEAQKYNGQNSEYGQLIHDKVAQLVQTNFEERQLRIDKLQQMLKDEQQKFDQDQASESQIIDQRTENILKRIERNSSAHPAPTTQPGPLGTLDGASNPDNTTPGMDELADSLQSVSQLAALAVPVAPGNQ